MRSTTNLLTLLAASLVLAVAGCSDVSDPKAPEFKTKLSSEEVKNSAFKAEFPLHYETYLRNNDDTAMTEYGGSVPHNKNDGVSPLPEGYKHAQPYLKNLWLGYPFSYEYRRARGHTYAVKDIMHIDRINRYGEKAGLPATCFNCKVTNMGDLVKNNGGDDFWAKDFNSLRENFDENELTIGCATCHDPANMELRLYSVPLQDYLKAEGKDFKTMSRNEKRALVCGQCHVEYYFQDKSFGPSKKPVFPWSMGKNPEEMYKYYKTHGDYNGTGFEGNFVDWVHPVSKTPMIKVQHPEYEMWEDGSHGAAGVTCADCHMNYLRLDGKKKISNHQWTSPLKDKDMKACRQCHTDKSPDYLRDRVVFSQKKVWDQLLVAQDISVKAHEAIRMAAEFEGEKPADYDQLMIEARDMCRKGQFFWDYVSAENSAGFHNPAKALDILASSQQYSQKAVDIAIKAAAFTTAEALSKDIKELVPPILKHSRELQMDPEHLASHKWLQYLKLTPKTEKVWDGNKRLVPKPAAS